MLRPDRGRPLEIEGTGVRVTADRRRNEGGTYSGARGRLEFRDRSFSWRPVGRELCPSVVHEGIEIRAADGVGWEP